MTGDSIGGAQHIGCSSGCQNVRDGCINLIVVVLSFVTELKVVFMFTILRLEFTQSGR